MLSKDLLIKEIPSLKLSDTGSIALSLMEDFKLKHLPIIDDGKYVCLVSERNIFSMDNIEDVIKGICLFAPYVGENTHILEILRIMGNDNLTLLPVVDEGGNLLGNITLSILTEKLSEITSAGSNGALIALEVNPLDYDLSNIVRLVESNNAKILSFFTYPLEDTGKSILMVKIDLEDASPVLRSFERFNYKVAYYFQKRGLSDDTQRDRLDELMYYLEM